MKRAAADRADAIGAAGNMLADALREMDRSEEANKLAGLANVASIHHEAAAGLPISAYVTNIPGISPCGVPESMLDRNTLTTWMGDFVAALEITGTARGFNGVKLTCYRCIINGRTYIGRGLGPGMYLNLRLSKRAR